VAIEVNQNATLFLHFDGTIIEARVSLLFAQFFVSNIIFD